ncbi:hypothetical protein D3C87_1487690 [compost metagenome]
MVCWRLTSTSVSRTGICSQRLSIRLPIGVTVLSSTAARVFSTPPAKFCVISRLRRVAASMMMLSCWRSIVIERICGRVVRCVSFTYCNRQPAAQRPRGALSTPKPIRSRVPNCRFNCWRAVSISNSHKGRRRRPRRPSIRAISAKSSA